MRLGHQRCQLRIRGDVADLPARQAERLARAADSQTALPQAGQGHQRDVPPAVERQVLIHLIAHGIGVMLLHQLRDEGQLWPR